MKTLFKTALMCVALAATAVSVSCNDPIEEPPATIKVTSVELGETELSLQTGEAETATLVATVLPADADNKVVTWESSDDEVVSIAPDGLVCVLTALKEGAATITVTTGDGGFEAQCVVTVSSVEEVTGVELDETELSLEMGGIETATLTAAILPTEADNKAVTWESSDDEVVSIAPDGLVCVLTALKAGEVTISVTSADGGFEAQCVVTVDPALVLIDSGTAGPLTWKVTDTHTLIISGEGAMPDYENYDFVNFRGNTPWADHLGNYDGSGGIRSIIVKEGVTAIGDYAFDHCKSLTEVSLPNSLTTMGRNVFSYCDLLKEVTIPGGVTHLPDYTFYRCFGLTGVTLPDGLTSIGYMAFQNCMALRNVAIPATVTSIGGAAFNGCSIMTAIAIPEGITSIAPNTFDTCSYLADVTIPNSVTSIGKSAFFYCSRLIRITLPDELTTLADRVFMGCSRLVEITIPETVTSMGTETLYNCYELTKITILAPTPPTADRVITSTYYEQVALYVPAGSVEAYKAHPAWGRFVNIIPISQ